MYFPVYRAFRVMHRAGKPARASSSAETTEAEELYALAIWMWTGVIFTIFLTFIVVYTYFDPHPCWMFSETLMPANKQACLLDKAGIT